MLRYLLCDDNIQILNRLATMLEKIFFKNNIEAEIVFKSTTAEETVKYINENIDTIDVLLLDINLKSSISGCDIADIARKKNKNLYIVFLTGHLEYALLAYKYKTFDYLSKPITAERLEETILRLIDDTKDSNAIFIKLNNHTIVKAEDIDYIKKDGMKLIFCTPKTNYEVYNSFSKIQNCLPENFVRCHKSYIVNVNNIKNFNSTNNSINFDTNSACLVGAKYKNNFLEVFKNGNSTDHLVSFIK